MPVCRGSAQSARSGRARRAISLFQSKGFPTSREVGMQAPEEIQTIVIGAGQAGLSVGYHLAKRGVPFLILEGNPRVGDSWRKRWDSLRLFTPARFDGLAGMPFPGDRHAFPTKDQMADYLEGYVAHFQLPVRTGVRVDRVSKLGDRF